MDWLEQELKQALARKDPSPDFADGVVRRANSTVPHRRGMLPRRLATAAAVMVIFAGAETWRWHQGLEAKHHVMEAMRLTAGALNHIQTRVKEVRP